LEKQENEINLLTKEIENLKIILLSYEKETTKILELEKKICNQQNFYTKKIQNYEEKYKELFVFINDLIKEPNNNINNINNMNSNTEEFYLKNDKDLKSNKKLLNKNFLKFNSKSGINKDAQLQFSTITIVKKLLNN